MGKWDKIVKDLPIDFGNDPGFQEKVNAIKRTVLDESPADDENEVTSETLEELVGEITAMQKVVNDLLIKAVGRPLTAARITQVWIDVRKMKDAYNEQESRTNAILEAYKQLLFTAYETEDCRQLKLLNDWGARIQPEPHSKVTDKQANRLWAVKEGLESELQLHWGTLNSITKKLLEAGGQPPDGVEVVNRPKVVIIRGDDD